jgi:acyl-CoA thioester hydrolase
MAAVGAADTGGFGHCERDMSEPFLTYKGTVYPWHCDHMGHMNVMWYVGKFDEATWQLFAAVGLTPAWLRAHDRGMAAVEQHVRYLRELTPGDVISVRTRVLEVKDKSLRFAHAMRHDVTGEAVAETELTAVHLDAIARRATAFPPAIRAACAGLSGAS